jgi:hypothetical protein
MMPHFDFPVLDAPRTAANAELFRSVFEELGIIEPFIDETDSPVTMPMRIAHNAAAGIVLEIGPYDLDHNDVDRLRDAIRAYDTTVNGSTMRRIK